MTATIELNPAHPIFNGHFPGQPVLPGVCMLQIIKELLEVSLGKPTRMRKASELKFLSLISPEETDVLQAQIITTLADGLISLDAKLHNNETVLFKFKGMFEELV
ncbi:hypothetical protein A0256_23825 [Mucilaginibacter sp. PAMC 26640]|nr:hypothetical protein A0256_23825 [Mucilaginibacter sp. PAMC 26640]